MGALEDALAKAEELKGKLAARRKAGTIEELKERIERIKAERLKERGK